MNQATRQRSAIEVVEKILDVIPESEKEFRKALTLWRAGIFMELPEDTLRYLGQVAKILDEFLPPVGKFSEFNDWQRKVIVVWRNGPPAQAE